MYIAQRSVCTHIFVLVHIRTQYYSLNKITLENYPSIINLNEIINELNFISKSPSNDFGRSADHSLSNLLNLIYF